VFTEPLPRNGLHNPALLLLRAGITLATAVPVAQQLLYGANTPQYLLFLRFSPLFFFFFFFFVQKDETVKASCTLK
jgi:hypothetical protein